MTSSAGYTTYPSGFKIPTTISHPLHNVAQLQHCSMQLPPLVLEHVELVELELELEVELVELVFPLLEVLEVEDDDVLDVLDVEEVLEVELVELVLPEPEPLGQPPAWTTGKN